MGTSFFWVSNNKKFDAFLFEVELAQEAHNIYMIVSIICGKNPRKELHIC